MSLCCVAAQKVSPYIDIVLLFLHCLVPWDWRVQHLFGNRVAINPGPGSDLSLSLMNRLNQTESAVFKLWMLYFQSISFSDYLEITMAVVVPCGGRKKSPRTSI